MEMDAGNNSRTSSRVGMPVRHIILCARCLQIQCSYIVPIRPMLSFALPSGSVLVEFVPDIVHLHRCRIDLPAFWTAKRMAGLRL